MLIHRYICKRLFAAFLFVSFAMAALLSVFGIIGELSAYKNNYSFVESLEYVGLLMPGNLFSVLPFVSMLSVLVIGGKMAEENEFIILRASGFSIARICTLILSFFFVLSCLFIVADNYLLNPLRAYAENFKQDHKYPGLREDSGIITDFWINEGDALIYLPSVKEDGSILSSFVYRFNDDNQIAELSRAESGSIENNIIYLDDIQSTSLTTRSTTKNSHDSIALKTKYRPKFLKIEKESTQNIGLNNLFSLSEYYKEQSRSIGNKYLVVFLQKILLPFNIVALVFFSLSFVFGSTRSISSATRISIGILTGLVFYTFNEMAVPLHLVFLVSPFVVALLPGLLAIATGFVVLRVFR